MKVLLSSLLLLLSFSFLQAVPPREHPQKPIPPISFAWYPKLFSECQYGKVYQDRETVIIEGDRWKAEGTWRFRDSVGWNSDWRTFKLHVKWYELRGDWVYSYHGVYQWNYQEEHLKGVYSHIASNQLDENLEFIEDYYTGDIMTKKEKK